MLAQLRRSLLFLGLALIAAGGAWAQTTTMEGDVKGQDGQPLKGAVIVLDRTDIKGHYQVKSDKKGHWLYTGLPFGKYDLTCTVNGQVMDKVTGVQSKYGDSTVVDFDLQKTAAAHQAQQQAANAGQATPDAERGMSKEQKEQYEAQLKQRSEAMKKNKALNDAYNAAQDAMKQADAEQDKAKKGADYQAAVDKFNQASQLDANQVAIWDGMGEAYAGLARTQTGDDQTKSYDAAIDAYKKSLAIKPDDAAVYNQMGNIYGAEKKIPEATEALNKAADLNPTPQGKAKAFFNMGANLVNTGKPEQAADFFKKATDADPSYAEAWFQYGSILMMSGKVDPKTGAQTYPPDTASAFKKYLELQPSGSHAQEAQAMLQALGEKVETQYTAPGARKKKQ
ncbi:MAG: tetratricopeptide repeat protein [Acidobacteriaceae bacterium]|nr:tetratricopeptide repeat protein [Acidobacteriaceae bacterium]